MYIPSITTIFGFIFTIYIAHAMWSLAQLFTVINCTSTPCFKSYLSIKPKLQLTLFTSQTVTPVNGDVTKIGIIKNFDYENELKKDFEIDIPSKTRRNGTLYLNVVIALNDRQLEWNTLQFGDGPTVIQRISLTEYAEPRAETFNLLGDKENNKADASVKNNNIKKSSQYIKPVSHIKSIVHIIMLTDLITMSYKDVPDEMARLIRINRKQEFLPIIQSDFFKTRLKDLQEITGNMKKTNITVYYRPIGIGKLRLMLQMEHATKSMLQLGFTHKDIDEIKGILSDTNYYLLLGTLFIGGIHLLFDFLSFKNDVQFWRKKNNYAGLSVRTTLWRAFSQIVIFLYLLDEDTSLLVIIPASISTIIELWKCKKILKIDITMKGLKFRTSPSNESTTNNKILKAEKRTQEFDKEAMKYLSYILYPLCISGAVYSLIYQPHRSWYSWTINSLVNGVYAFGFLFMLPQLFVNYKLKSVAALPWRAFMYKAFNTFIDDVFAFIITMPIAHRVACFRDDIVFVIYLYQRWLYPVDKSRIDSGLAFDDNENDDNDNGNVNNKNGKANNDEWQTNKKMTDNKYDTKKTKYDSSKESKKLK